MNKKVILLVIVIAILIVISCLYFLPKKKNITLSEKEIQKVEEYLATAFEIDLAILKSDIEKGEIVQCVYESPKTIRFLNDNEREVLQWQIIKKQNQCYIIVYDNSSSYVFDFPEFMVEQLQANEDL